MDQKLSRLGECLVFHRFVFGSYLLNLFIVSMYNKNIASVYSTQRSLTSKLDEMCLSKFPFTFAFVHVWLSTVKFSKGLRPGSKVCSEHMNDWQYLSLGDLESNKMIFFPKVNLDVFLCLNVPLWPRDVSRDQKLKMKEIGELVANLLCLDKQIGISERG